jgi:hypothetical protein
MLGATVTHLIHGEPQVITTVVLTALLAIVLYLGRAVNPTPRVRSRDAHLSIE